MLQPCASNNRMGAKKDGLGEVVVRKIWCVFEEGQAVRTSKVNPRNALGKRYTGKSISVQYLGTLGR